jgi:hypothetical protein
MTGIPLNKGNHPDPAFLLGPFDPTLLEEDAESDGGNSQILGGFGGADISFVAHGFSASFYIVIVR